MIRSDEIQSDTEYELKGRLNGLRRHYSTSVLGATFYSSRTPQNSVLFMFEMSLRIIILIMKHQRFGSLYFNYRFGGGGGIGERGGVELNRTPLSPLGR